MNLLTLRDFKPSSESEENINDINSFLSDLKSAQKSKNNQINIVKVELNKTASAPVEIPKSFKSPVQEKKEGISISDCLIKGSSLIHNQKSNCEFSDSDIEFSDFMFSDNDEKKDKDSKNTKNINNTITKKIAVEEIPEKTVQVITTDFNINTENNKNNTIKNNLDEICLEDNDLNDENNVFELSDISLSDKKEEINPTSKKEEIKININTEIPANSSKPTNTDDAIKDKNTNIIDSHNTNNDTNIKIEPTAKKEQNTINIDNNDNINESLQIESKGNEINNNKIESEKPQSKKVIKKRKKPIKRNDVRSPLNILDDLQLSFDDKKEESISNQTKQSDFQDNLYSPTVEKIKIEKVEKGKLPLFEQTTLPPLHTRSIETHTRTGVENFEYSFVSNLEYYLSDFRSEFLTQFQNQIQKSFDYDSLVKNFLFNFTRELNDIIVNSSNCQDYVPASFSDIESNLNSEFNQFSSFFSNSEKVEKDQFLIDEQFLPIDQVESIHSKLTNDCKFLLGQISKESQFLNQPFQDDNRFNLNSKLIEISELESKLIQINTEKDFVDYKLHYIQEKSAEIQEKFELINKFNNNDSNQSEFDELLTKLKEMKKKNVDFKFNNNDHKLTFKEICDFISIISSQFNSIPFHSKEKTFLSNNNGFANINTSMNAMSFQYTSFDSSSYSQSGIIEDVKNRLLRARKMREETIADLRNYGPRYNVSLYGI